MGSELEQLWQTGVPGMFGEEHVFPPHPLPTVLAFARSWRISLVLSQEGSAG